MIRYITDDDGNPITLPTEKERLFLAVVPESAIPMLRLLFGESPPVDEVFDAAHCLLSQEDEFINERRNFRRVMVDVVMTREHRGMEEHRIYSVLAEIFGWKILAGSNNPDLATKEGIPVEVKNEDIDNSALAQIQRYMREMNRYVGVLVGTGCKPELPKNIVFFQIKYDHDTYKWKVVAQKEDVIAEISKLSEDEDQYRPEGAPIGAGREIRRLTGNNRKS